jgi:chaperonin GroES
LATVTATSLKPLGDRVLVEPLEAEEVTKSGIYLPDTAKEKPQEGTVIAVGSGRVDEKGTRHELEVKQGNKILYGKYSGTEIKLEGKEYLIVSERDILAVFES